MAGGAARSSRSLGDEVSREACRADVAGVAAAVSLGDVMGDVAVLSGDWNSKSAQQLKMDVSLVEWAVIEWCR